MWTSGKYLEKYVAWLVLVHGVTGDGTVSLMFSAIGRQNIMTGGHVNAKLLTLS